MNSNLQNGRFELFVRCAGNCEDVLLEELKLLGCKKMRPLTGGISLYAKPILAYKICLWSRVASRVLLVIDRLVSKNSDELYFGIKNIPWENHFDPSKTISVSVNGINEELRNSAHSALVIKDAIVDRFREVFGERPSIDTKNADIHISANLRGDRLSVYLDLSGQSMHKRFYREDGVGVAAPIKENLAAALLLKSSWTSIMQNEKPQFLDPMCGSGTFAIEAAMMALNIAPGLKRVKWGFFGWKQFEQSDWDDLLLDAKSKKLAHHKTLEIFAFDSQSSAISKAIENAKRAGVDKYITFKTCKISSLSKLLKNKLKGGGLLFTNPPYGLRLLDGKELSHLYEDMYVMLGSIDKNWKFGLISADSDIDSKLGIESEVCQEVYNGKIEAYFRMYDLKNLCDFSLQCESLGGISNKCFLRFKQSEQFYSRFRRVAKEKISWAAEKHIDCFRIYDADLPDYALAIDIYFAAIKLSDISKPALKNYYVCISEYKAPSEIPEFKTKARLEDAVVLVCNVLDVPRENIFVKTRTKAKGGSQYGLQDKEKVLLYACEGPAIFELNMTSYLDTGLFLDHRLTRMFLAALAKDKSFLNLFAYTGSASVYAAFGGARSTKTVDMSKTYIEWAKRNMSQNGFLGRSHEFVEADVLKWISSERQSKNRYDLIFIDPPTFSNSKSMGSKTWSVQRDHGELLVSVSRLLTRGGIIVFSCNFKGFKIDSDKLNKYGITVKDISDKSIPEDFKRNSKIHYCYVLERT